jgi:predicted deacetylase
MEKGSMIVSLHDVCPSSFLRIQKQWDELRELGLSKMSLLLVPFFHSEKFYHEDKSLCEWLECAQSLGHEIVLHGWFHQNAVLQEKKAPGFKTWFFENLYTSGEAEFLNLNYQEAHRKISEGLKLFRETNFKVQGFIAPAWLMNSQVERAAKDHGLNYTNTVAEIVHLPSNKRFPSRSCVWSTRSQWRRVCSLGWNAFLFKSLNGVEPLRISLHPCDLEYSAVWLQIKRFIKQALINREAMTYGEWMAKFANN